MALVKDNMCPDCYRFGVGCGAHGSEPTDNGALAALHEIRRLASEEPPVKRTTEQED